jgi:hypothetical protein
MDVLEWVLARLDWERELKTTRALVEELLAAYQAFVAVVAPPHVDLPECLHCAVATSISALQETLAVLALG